MKIKINVTVDEELIEKLDKKRGLIPRSTYINELIRNDVVEK
jgi:metal-responsive CopG/Arc/MetJ family transcriptional regulator